MTTAESVHARTMASQINGFMVAEVLPNGYRLARLSDGATLDEFFGVDEVMKERRSRPR